MSRIVVHNDHGPVMIKRGDVPLAGLLVCRCGLSAKQPLCDGSHAVTRDEPADVLYQYTRAGPTWRRKAVTIESAPEPVETDGHRMTIESKR